MSARSRCWSRRRGRPRSRPLCVFVLTDKDFRDHVKESPAVERKVLRALARRVVELSRDLTVA